MTENLTDQAVTLREFLAGFFGPQGVDKVHITHFSADPGLSASKWKGKRLGARTMALPHTDNQYFCIAELADGADRVLGGVAFHHMIIADDVGTKVQGEQVDKLLDLLGKPTAKVRTSPGNETWLWRLSIAVAAQDLPRVSWLNAVRDFMKNEGLTDAATADAVRYIRLPFGINSKEKYQSPFDGSYPRCELVEWSPENSVWLEGACERAFGADWELKIASGNYLAQALQAAQGPMQYSASMNDPWVRMAEVIGLNPRPGAAGRIDADCPNMAAHTVKGDTGFAFLGDDLCECHHAACQGLRVPDFKRMMENQYRGLAAFGGLPDAGLPGTPEGFIARCEFEQAGDAGQALEEADKIVEAQAEREQNKRDLFDALCDRFVHVGIVDMFFDTKSGAMLGHSAVDHDPEVLKIAEAGAKGKNRGSARLLNSGAKLRRVVGLVYKPGNPNDLVVMDAGANGKPIKCLNTYRPSDVPRVAGKPSAFLELLAFLYPEKDKREFLLNSMAFHAQFGNERLPLLHLLSGGQGIGKDILLGAYFHICGEHNRVEVSPEMLASGFNEWLINRNIYLPEMKVSRKDYSKLKGWINSDTLIVSINPKGQKAYQMRLAPAFWASTNDVDAIGIDADDRRVVVLRSFAKPNRDPLKSKDATVPGTAAWFERIAAEIKRQDGELLDFMLTRNVSGWRPQTAPDFGDGAKADMRLASMSSAEMWVSDLFAEGGVFEHRTLINLQEVEALARTADLQIVRNTITPQAIQRGMMDAGFERHRTARIGGIQRRLWARDGAHPASNFEMFTGKNKDGKTLGDLYADEKDAWLRSQQAAGLGTQVVPPGEA